MVKAKDPKGPWSEPVLVKAGKASLTLVRFGMKTGKYIWYTHTQEAVPD